MKRAALLMFLALITACIATAYPVVKDENPVRLRIENRHSGMGIVVARVMCDGIQVQAIRDLPLNAKRTVNLRRALDCAAGLYVDLTDVTGNRLYWRSEVLPVSEGSTLMLVMGATLNLSTFYPIT